MLHYCPHVVNKPWTLATTSVLAVWLIFNPALPLPKTVLDPILRLVSTRIHYKPSMFAMLQNVRDSKDELQLLVLLASKLGSNSQLSTCGMAETYATVS